MSYSTMPEYNGYVNYPTWAVSNFVQNDEAVYEYWTREADKLYNNALDEVEDNQDCEFSAKQIAVGEISLNLKEQFEEDPVIIVHTEHGASTCDTYDLLSPYTDLLQATMKYVDWGEIADMLVEGVLDSLDYQAENEGK